MKNTEAKEFNEACAKKLGWKPAIVGFVDDPIPGAPCQKVALLENTPDYVGSISAAWEIVESIIADGKRQIKENGISITPSFVLRMGPVGVFHCELGDSGKTGWYQPTAPLAIVRAFLKL